MCLTSCVDIKHQKQFVHVGQKVLAVVAKYKSPSCRSLVHFGCLTPGNGTACQMNYSLILICCHQSFKSPCTHQVNGDYIESRKS